MKSEYEIETWNIGSLQIKITENKSKQISECKQEPGWDKGGVEPANSFIFFGGKVYINHLVTSFSYYAVNS